MVLVDIASLNVTSTVVETETSVELSVGEIDETVGGVVSITNDLIFNVTLLAEELVTVIVQFEYVPSLKEFKVIVLVPAITEVVLEEQEPP
jgi:hypothetical protein|tara:strand:- start:15 stop:287 length:273 start_codon:yes stop_codon:yes gene_type:complete